MSSEDIGFEDKLSKTNRNAVVGKLNAESHHGPKIEVDGRGKRVHDRHSGSDKSGVKSVVKKDGHGAHNWGDSKDEINEGKRIYENGTDDNAEAKPKPAAPSENKPKPASGTKEMTLDEYKQEQEKSRSVPQHNVRKAGEGENSTQWKETFVIKKDEEQTENNKHDAETKPTSPKTKQPVNIEIKFGDETHQVNGTPSSPSNANSVARSPPKCAPKVNDEKDFPSLVTSA